MIINEEIKDILDWLEPTLKQNQNPQDIGYWSKIKTIFFEHMKEVVIESIKDNKFYSFMYVVQYVMQENKNILEEIKEQVKREEKLQEIMNEWLGEKFIKQDIENIKFLLDFGAEKEIIYKKIKELIETSSYDNFKLFVQKFKVAGIITYEEIKGQVKRKGKLQEIMNEWLEKFSEECDKKDKIEILLDCGAEAKIFKEKGIITLEEIKEQVKREGKLQEIINEWLGEKFIKQDIENIKFLLSCGAEETIIKNLILNKKISDSNFYDFKSFIMFEKAKIITYEEIYEKIGNEGIKYLLKLINKKNTDKYNYIIKRFNHNSTMVKEILMFLSERDTYSGRDTYSKSHVERNTCRSIEYDPMDKDMSSRK